MRFEMMMFTKKIIQVLLLALPFTLFSQDFSESWRGHFSFNNVSKIVEGDGQIFAASENAIFVTDINTNEIRTITTVNGLSGDTISTLLYSETFELLIVGYETGLIQIIFNDSQDVLTVVDIIDKLSIPSNDRRINNFLINESTLFISTNFGISVFDLERLEFGDTYFIGDGGAQIPVSQVAIFNGIIYAACLDNNGIRSASLANPNLIDFMNWDVILQGSFIGIISTPNALYALSSNRNLFQFTEGSNPLVVFTYQEIPTSIATNANGGILVTTNNTAFFYDTNFNLVTSVVSTANFDTRFTSLYANRDTLFIGTTDFGILTTTTNDTSVLLPIKPEGPLLNRIFSMTNVNGDLWCAFSGFTRFYVFDNRLLREGISRFNNDEWTNIPFDSISSQIGDVRYISNITINPFNTSQVFASSYFSGLIEINNNEVVGLFDETNSTLSPFNLDINLTLSGTYDDQGALWLMNGRVERPLNRFLNGQWTSFDFSEIIGGEGRENVGFSDVIIESNTGTKFIGSHDNGIIAFNETNNGRQINSLDGEQANMPTSDVRALALDRNNQLWIGTSEGLRVLFNINNFIEEAENLSVSQIIIEQEGVARELLDDQFITDIKVDGSNNKWISTSGSGVFLFSEDGQQTIFQFTTQNSPLPSNNVNAISLDEAQGIVYFGTERGLVSFNSGSSSPSADFSSARAYPNPVRPNFDIVEERVKITDLAENVNIKIVDIEGNLVAEAQTGVNRRFSGFNLEIDGGTAFWNGKNLANNVVATGVYLIMLADLDNLDTKVIKLLVVR